MGAESGAEIRARFEAATADFRAAAETGVKIRRELIETGRQLDELRAAVRLREREVAGSPAVQDKPTDGSPHNDQTRAARAEIILSQDLVYLDNQGRIEALTTLRAHYEIELEEARDARTVARRAMDFEVAYLYFVADQIPTVNVEAAGVALLEESDRG